MAQRIVTIDINASGVRILQVQGDRAERWGFLPLFQGAVAETGIVDPQALGLRIKQLMRATGMRGNRVIASISGLYSVSRMFDMDFQPAEGTDERLRQQIEDAIPAEGLRFHWQPMVSDGAKHRVLVVGAPETIVQDHIRILQAAGLSPVAMETSAMALVRAVGKRSLLVANTESASLDVVIVVGGIPEVMRTLAMPPALGTLERAEFVARALKQTIGFYQARQPEANLPADTELLLVGPLARDPDFRKAMATETGLPLASFATAVRVPSHLALEEYAVNLGLALRSASKDSSEQSDQAVRLTIDLRPRRIRVSVPVWARVLAGVTVAGLALVFLLYSRAEGPKQETFNLQQRLTILDRQVALRRGELTQMSQMEAVISEFGELVAPQGDLTGVLEQINDITEKLNDITPAGIEITSLSATASNVGLNGNATSPEVAIAYVEALRASGLFSKVEYTRTQTGELALSLGADRATQPKK